MREKVVLACDDIEFSLPPTDLSEFCCDSSIISHIAGHYRWDRLGAAITYLYQLFDHKEQS